MNQGSLKLEKFQNKGKKKQKKLFLTLGIVVFLLVGGVILYRSYAVYQEQKEYNAIKGSVPNYIDDYDVKVALTIDGNATDKFPSKTDGKWPETVSCDKGGATGYWDHESWSLVVKNLTQTRTKCQVNFITKHFDGELNGTDPVLKDGMIPVTIDSNGTVKKAGLDSDWYNYRDKRWANVVILNDESVTYQNGQTIPETNIESYFVWIPRYRYQIFNEGNYTALTSIENKKQEIQVKFETKEVAKSTGSKVGTWLTHPAFTAFGETNGMWVGKFETGYKDAATKEEAQKNENNPSKVQIKPNVYSWRNIQVANAYLSSKNYKTEYNSHMMKNTEWGAVAYLQHSRYGSSTSVRINNNENYLTGYAAKKEPTCGYTASNDECNKYESTAPGVDGTYTIPWNRTVSADVYGALASTTSNITGVYDMSGGAWEYVMGVMKSQSGVPCSGRDATYNSGFNGPYCNTTGTKTDGIPFPENSDYYDVYEYATVDERYDRRILGDATGEMGPFTTKTYGTQNRQIGSWYDDEAWFVFSGLPWFARGSAMFRGIDTGVFASVRDHGNVYNWISFRANTMTKNKQISRKVKTISNY